MFRWCDRLLFKTIDVRQLAILRIGLGILVAINLLELLPHSVFHFSDAGWLGEARDLKLDNCGSWSILFLLNGALQTQVFFIFSLIFAIGFTIGYKTRLCAWVTFVVLASIWNRNPLILDGDDAVLRIMMFYLAISPCGNALSVDAAHNDLTLEVEAWPLRLIQFQFAFIYFVSGWVKFHSEQWMNGTILQYVLIHPEYSRWDFTAILDNPTVILALDLISRAVRWWELAFPVLLLHPYSRMLAILIGVTFHLGLIFLMNLRWFSYIMIVLYVSLINNEYFKNIPGSVFSKKRLAFEGSR